MLIRNINKPAPQPQAARGFTLIEFMVASSLGLVVLLAIGTTYGITARMRRAAEARVAVQQDLRNASELILRDAQMAGSFGCFNLGNLRPKVQQSADGQTGFVIPNTNNQVQILAANTEKTSGVYIVDANQINNPGFPFTVEGQALIFTYGLHPVPLDVAQNGAQTDGDVAPELRYAAGGINRAGPLALASCSSLYIEKSGLLMPAAPGSTGPLKIAINRVRTDKVTDSPGSFYLPQTALMQVETVLYAVGQGGNAPSRGFYRFTLQRNGAWGSPQLLAANVTSMAVRSLYSGCTNKNSKPSFSTEFAAINRDLTLSRRSLMPTSVEVRLTVPNNGNTYGNISQYLIRANVRGGNVCANQY
jgi:hypothetical protein